MSSTKNQFVEMKVLDHEHPFTLIDQNPEYPHDEVVYDDEEELIMKQDFRCPYGRCGQEINFYHRFYYTCNQCSYSLHKFCAELPTTLRHKSHHEHALILNKVSRDNWCMCQCCTRTHLYEYLNYRCIKCNIFIGLGCAGNDTQNNIIYHPSHPHPIMSIPMDILASCHACDKKHQGNFFHCTTCFRFFAHKNCVFLRKKLLIQGDNFNHSHPLTLAYSFPKDDQKAKFYPRCKICELQFDENLWIYKCVKCRYYVHTNCVTTSASLNFIGNQGTSGVFNYLLGTENNPIFVHLPFLDQTIETKVLKHLFYGESGSGAFETNLTHPFHEHPLTFVDTSCCDNDLTAKSTASTSSGQDSMKMVERLCNACIRPITNMSFYKCAARDDVDDDVCNFFIHAWCTRLPTQIMKTGFKHEKITLKLLPPQQLTTKYFFECYYCKLKCNGFGYFCRDPYRITDVYCGVTPEYITHKSHPKHVLRKTMRGRFRSRFEDMYCRLCLSDTKSELFYSCWTCKFHMHIECALLWPETVSHKYDKHPMTLRYCPAENYSGDYFCEVCEEEINPNGCFYHCDQCLQSMHPACVVSIHEKASTCAPFYLERSVELIDNMNFW